MQVVEKTVYEEGRNDRYRDRETRGRANAGLTLGIIGTVLGAASLWGRNGLGGSIGSFLGGGSGGGSLPANVNINATGGNGAGCYAPTPFEVYAKESNDTIDLVKGMYDLYIATSNNATKAREVDVAEKFGLYKSMIDADFGLYKLNRDGIDTVNNRLNAELFSQYKYTRDKDDELRNEISDLKAQVAVNNAIRPYQDKLIMCEIEKAYTASLTALERRTCKMVEGYVCLPNEPTVKGLLGATCCFPRTAAATGGGTTPTT